MKLLFKKRFFKPIIEIIPFEDSFSTISKSNKQYIHKSQEFKLPFSPSSFTFFNNTFYYLYKNKIYMKNDEKFEEIKLPCKVYSLNTFNNSILLSDKKLMKLELLERNGQLAHRITEQFYGPVMKISQTSVFENKILAICFGTNNVYLFDNKNHLIFENIDQPFSCHLIDEDNFVVGSQDLYFFNINKKKAQNKVKIGSRITKMTMVQNEMWVGTENGRVIRIVNNKILDEIQIDGIINDILILGDEIIIASGNEFKDGRWEVKNGVKNYLSIYKK